MSTAPKAPRVCSDRGFWLFVMPAFEQGASALGLDRRATCEAAVARARSIPGGRGPNRLLESTDWPQPVRLRPARHGGFLGRLLGDRYLTPNRARRELALWSDLRERGAALPEPALVLSRRRGLFWHNAFGAVQLETALDGVAWLETGPAAGELATATTLLARTLRRFHDVGGVHGDLQLRNTLFERGGDGMRCWLVDLDRSQARAHVSATRRMRELMRLARSLEKRGRTDLLDRRSGARFLVAYCEGDRALRRAMLDALPREARRLARHRLGWRLGRWISASTATLLGLAAHSGTVAPAFLALLASLITLACSPEADGSGVANERARRPPARLSLLAVGDTGRTRSFASLFEGQLAVAAAMVKEDERAPVDALILLGDNFYWHGLESELLVERLRDNLVRPYCRFVRLTGTRSDEVRDACPIEPDRRHPIPIHAVLGNHDLERPESPRLQREVIPQFVPNWNMSAGLAEVVELGEGVSLILFESEVAIRDEPAIRRALIEAVGRARGPWRILATHRPIATDDLGGVPLGGYPGFVRNALAAAGAPVQLVLAAHHHNLQAFELREPSALLQVGLGSGSRAEPPLAHADHPDARFGALELGFGRVELRGAGDAERLVVSLYGAPRWPWLTRWRDPRLLATFEVDLAGRVTPAESD